MTLWNTRHTFRISAFVTVVLFIAGSADGVKKHKINSTTDAAVYLQQYGFIKEGPPDNAASHSLTTISKGVKKYQKRYRKYGLKPTGLLDTKTMTMMNKPRCGVLDIGEFVIASNLPDRNWRKGEKLRWKITKYIPGLSKKQQKEAMKRAFSKWSEVTSLSFQRVAESSTADLEIRTVSGSTHNDGYPFDGEGGTLAHAFYPRDGRIHFDGDEKWSLGTGKGVDMEIVAAHEIGHAIGLMHSKDPKALMAPFYSYDPNYKLQADDISGARKIYGKVSLGSVSPKPKPKTPVVSGPALNPGGSTEPNFCNVKTGEGIDAVMRSRDGYTYLFRSEWVYIFDSYLNLRLKTGINSVFGSLPLSPDAAVYDEYRDNYFIFKGAVAWEYQRLSWDKFRYSHRDPLSTDISAAFYHTTIRDNRPHVYLQTKTKKLKELTYHYSSGTGRTRVRDSPVNQQTISQSYLLPHIPDRVKAAYERRGEIGLFMPQRKTWVYSTTRRSGASVRQRDTSLFSKCCKQKKGTKYSCKGN